jgi:hypothetical protein
LLELSSEISPPHPVILEYPIFNERADVIFVGKDKALVIEAKGWRQVKKIGNSVVEAEIESDGENLKHVSTFSTGFLSFPLRGIGLLLFFSNLSAIV